MQFGGLTIAGIGGIYKSHSSTLGRFETCPLDQSTMRSLYHTRTLDHFMMQQVCACDSLLLSLPLSLSLLLSLALPLRSCVPVSVSLCLRVGMPLFIYFIYLMTITYIPCLLASPP